MKAPKTDLHNHGLLGGKLEEYQDFCGHPLPRPGEFKDFQEFDRYILVDLIRHLDDKPVSVIQEHILQLFALTLRSARRNGVVIIEPSLDCGFIDTFGGDSAAMTRAFTNVIELEGGGIDVRPELGVARQMPRAEIERLVLPQLESGFFKSLDIYSDERLGELADLVRVFKRAGELGIKKKAHAGELRDADFVRQSVETLGLDAVQHGIAAAQSPEVMRWLSERGTLLNVCPTSNIKLKRAADYRSHPLRTLIDNSVRLSIASDDALVFESEVSDEYLHLFSSGGYAAHELDDIRLAGLAG